ncbi:MAG: hypothetical protein ACRYGA_05025 [Janthinobacterium lividum]
MSRWRLALLLIAGVAYAGLSHWMMVFHADAPWAIAVLLGPLWLTALGIAGTRLGRWGLAAVAVGGAILVWALARGEAGNPDRLYVLQHFGINAVLGCWFGGTLRGGRLSLIGEFAQRIQPMDGALRAYTRQVTWVWTGCFAVTALGSIAIYLWLPFAAWSLWANVLSPLMVGVLFVGEHLLRYRLHPEFQRTRMIDAIRAFYSHGAAPPASTPNLPDA